MIYKSFSSIGTFKSGETNIDISFNRSQAIATLKGLSANITLPTKGGGTASSSS